MRSFDRDLKTACNETGGARKAHTLSFSAAAPWRRCPSAGAALSLSLSLPLSVLSCALQPALRCIRQTRFGLALYFLGLLLPV